MDYYNSFISYGISSYYHDIILNTLLLLLLLLFLLHSPVSTLLNDGTSPGQLFPTSLTHFL